MPTTPPPGRLAGFPTDDDRLDALLDHRAPRPPVGDELHPLAELLAAVRAPASTAELAGQHTVLAAYQRIVGVSPSARRRKIRRPTMLSALLSAKLAAAAAASAVAVGGLAAAAYTGVLPTPLQNAAHDTIGAPPANDSGVSRAGTRPTDTPTQPTLSATPSVRPTPGGTPVGPDATGAAAYGLCTAYAAAQTHGTVSPESPAWRNLAAAAGGPGNIPSYCATVTRPGATPTHPTGRPSTLPTPAATHATGRPSSTPPSGTSHPTGKPSAAPSPAANHPTGRPTAQPTHASTGGPAAATGTSMPNGHRP